MTTHCDECGGRDCVCPVPTPSYTGAHDMARDHTQYCHYHLIDKVVVRRCLACERETTAEIDRLRANALPSHEEAVERCYGRGFFVTPLTLDRRGISANMADGKITPADLIAIAVVMRGQEPDHI